MLQVLMQIGIKERAQQQLHYARMQPSEVTTVSPGVAAMPRAARIPGRA